MEIAWFGLAIYQILPHHIICSLFGQLVSFSIQLFVWWCCIESVVLCPMPAVQNSQLRRARGGRCWLRQTGGFSLQGSTFVSELLHCNRQGQHWVWWDCGALVLPWVHGGGFSHLLSWWPLQCGLWCSGLALRWVASFACVHFIPFRLSLAHFVSCWFVVEGCGYVCFTEGYVLLVFM